MEKLPDGFEPWPRGFTPTDGERNLALHTFAALAASDALGKMEYVAASPRGGYRKIPASTHRE